MNEIILTVSICSVLIAAVVFAAVVLKRRRGGEEQSFGMLQQQLTAIQDQMRQTMEIV